MAKINILPQHVYNRIAAGEVIDRPYSVVKELVENAIDAGATEIQIYVESGGKQLIRVVDNGVGIERDDLHAAFLPHATSKLEKAEDLERIMTLGFRGEAVASIASVSKMTITSKTEEGDCYQLCSNGGELGEILPAAGDKGTDVKVEDLFGNMVVRRKYLRTDKTEESEITTYVSRFILSHSEIAFTYYANGRKVLQSFGEGDEAALACVYGANILNDLFQIDAQKYGIRIRGYIGNQNFSKPNKSYQSVFLNGRFVQNALISSAMSSAYSSYLMKRQYPFYVLYLTVPPEIVDVNVHPNKTDVRFVDNHSIYGCINSVVAAVLDGNSKAFEYLVSTPKTALEPMPEPTLKQPAAAFTVKPDESSSLPTAELEEGYEEARSAPLAPIVGVREPVMHRHIKYDKPVEKSKDKFFVPAFLQDDEEEEKETKPAEPEKKKFSYEEALEEIQKGTFKGPKTTRGVPIIEVPFAEVKPAKEAAEKLNQKVSVRPRIIAVTKVMQGVTQKYYHTEFRREGSNPYRSRPQKKEGEICDAELLRRRKFPKLFFQKNRIIVEQGEQSSGETAKFTTAPSVDVFEENKKFLMEMEGKKQQNRIDVSSCRYVGKLFNTYLLYEKNDEVYVIDQHAAHERLIFDRLKEKMEARKIVQQPMLVPFTLDLNAFESDFIREHTEDIRALGFDLEEFGTNSFKISAVPLDLQQIDLSVFFNDVLGNIGAYKGIRLSELLKDKLASAACKAAVKGGMDLSRDEVDTLFEMMDGNMGLKCPHGRPVVTKITKKELEKMFKRIV
ncbi:MAG: DNA mismatch repair endonuclease MutL [Clostridia bacterium]|nr:DNA mismatch repair endonuclease MutL [Clostridia bacterium]